MGAADFEARAHDTDIVRMRVLFPSLDDGRPKPGRYPALVFIQGGFVPTSRYAWLGEELVRAGYVVAYPENSLGLAFFSTDNGEVARQLLVDAPPRSLLDGLVDTGRVSVAGHSLGGVVAIKLALLGNFRSVIVEASFPDGADAKALERFAKPSLFLAGAKDCQAKREDIERGWASMPSPTVLSVLEGVTHFQFTDSDGDDVKRNCPPEAELADAHARIAATVRLFLDAANSGAALPVDALDAVAGSEVSSR